MLSGPDQKPLTFGNSVSVGSGAPGGKMPKTDDYHEIRAWRKRRNDLLTTYIQQLDILEELLMNAVIQEYEQSGAPQS